MMRQLAANAAHALRVTRTHCGVGRATAALALAPQAPRRAFSATPAPQSTASNDGLTQTMRDDAQYILNTYARQKIELVRGEGVWVYDAQDKKYLDFHSGIAVNSIGHSDPDWVDALHRQSRTLTHVSNLFYSRPQIELAKRLLDAAGGKFDKVFFCNSGTEANEAAIKLVRKYQLVQHQKRTTAAAASTPAATQSIPAPAAEANATRLHDKLNILTFAGGFHGRTLGALALTYKWQYRSPFLPLMDDVSIAKLNDAAVLKTSINAQTAAVFVEPVQGEGGVNVCSADFLSQIQQQCKQHDALLVVDEVQCGLSRTGSVFAHQNAHFRPAVEPDMMTLAKPLAGGLPIGAVLIKQRVAECMANGDHGSTFAGGALVTAAANAVVNKLTRPDVLSNIKHRSEQIKDGLRAIGQRLEKKGAKSRVVDVRGLGLLIGFELNVPVAPIMAAATARGLMLISAGEKILRICPPLIISRDEVDFALTALERAIEDAEAQPQPEQQKK